MRSLWDYVWYKTSATGRFVVVWRQAGPVLSCVSCGKSFSPQLQAAIFLQVPSLSLVDSTLHQASQLAKLFGPRDPTS